MAYSIANVGADLEGILHGTTLNQVTNLYGVYNRAARQLLEDVDPQETKRIVNTSGPIFTGVFDYPLPADVKGNKIVDIRPQVSRQLRDVWLQTYNQEFDVSKVPSLQDQFTINFNTSLKTIRISAPFLPEPVLINDASTVSSNGTWSAGGGATTPTVDNQNFVLDGGSLMFNLAAGQATGYLENSTMNAVNLEDALNQATQFLYTYLPSATAVTAVEFRFGSGSSDYYSLSTSLTQQNTAFQVGWNLLAYAWASMTVTGSPDPSAIDYIRVTWTYDGTLQTGVRLNAISSSLGNVLQLEYYSKYLFRDVSTGAYQETVTDTTNLVNLDTESYNLFLYQVAVQAVQQQQGVNAASYDGPYFENKYQQALARYQAMYKSEIQKPTQRYYYPTNPSYTQYFGRRFQ